LRDFDIFAKEMIFQPVMKQSNAKHPLADALQTNLLYNSIADGASHVVKVNVDSIGTALLEPGRDILMPVVDGCREAQIFH